MLRLRRTGRTLTGFASLRRLDVDATRHEVHHGRPPARSTSVSPSPATIRADGGRPVSPTRPAGATAGVRTHRGTAGALQPLDRLDPQRNHVSSAGSGRWPQPGFVEIYNARSIFEDLTGWRLSGDIDFKFPDGFKLQAGEFVASPPRRTISKPSMASPMSSAYTNALPNDAGTVRLRNNTDAIRLEVDYSDNPPWPAAADGAGLARAGPSQLRREPSARRGCQ